MATRASKPRTVQTGRITQLGMLFVAVARHAGTYRPALKDEAGKVVRDENGKVKRAEQPLPAQNGFEWLINEWNERFIRPGCAAKNKPFEQFKVTKENCPGKLNTLIGWYRASYAKVAATVCPDVPRDSAGCIPRDYVADNIGTESKPVWKVKPEYAADGLVAEPDAEFEIGAPEMQGRKSARTIVNVDDYVDIGEF